MSLINNMFILRLCVTVGIIFSLTKTQGNLYISISTRNILFGTTEVPMRCISFERYSKDDNDEKELVLDFRQNDKSEWTSIRNSNTSRSHFVQNLPGNGTVRKIRFMDYDCESPFRYRCSVDISVQVQFEQCLRDSEKPTFRCRILSKNLTVDRSEDVRLQITGRLPKDIGMPTITLPDNLQRTTIAKFKGGDVLKIQCTGEIENTDLLPRENFRWCKSVTSQSGTEKYEIISIQDDAVSNITSESIDGCALIKRSEIFYHVSKEDINFNITCELGYKSYDKKCGLGRFNGMLSIPTTAEVDHKWKLSPILIHDEDNILDSRKITLEGWGKTFTLLATASVRATNETKVERMQWCVKKENDTTWKRVKLQEDAIQAMDNSSETITLFSKITYHVTVQDGSIDFLVELSPSSTCKSGNYFTNISLLIKEKGTSTVVNKDNDTVNGHAWRSFSVFVIILLVAMLSSIAVLLIFTHRRGHVTFFGFTIKTERPDVNSLKEVTLQSDSKVEIKHQAKETSNEQYENSECKSNRDEGQGYYSNTDQADIPTSLQEETYEEIQKRDNPQENEEYEGLKF
uniref:Uncharacterized protein LOC111112994 n=1 Tax=Crassostrea virginica TaxID=6565 RepID=A0A8B8BTE0_CRAVI|nr:uncharacterized protein LOC111112994 [Crassostrea virginica]